jgi:hypothetical protein
MIQFPLASYPTARTAWFNDLAQLLKIVFCLYVFQLVASTATETGYTLMAAFNEAADTVETPVECLVPLVVLQVSVFPVYG